MMKVPDNVSERPVDHAVVFKTKTSKHKKHYKKLHHQFAISLMALILEWSRITKEKTKHIFWNELAEEMCRLRLQKGYKTPKVPVIHETTLFKSLW